MIQGVCYHSKLIFLVSNSYSKGELPGCSKNILLFIIDAPDNIAIYIYQFIFGCSTNNNSGQNDRIIIYTRLVK